MLFRSDRKSTRLNSSHTIISYAVFCLKKKKELHTSRHSRRTSHTPRRGDAAASASGARTNCAPVSRLPAVGPDGRSGFFFNDTATTEIYTLSLHDALPI